MTMNLGEFNIICVKFVKKAVRETKDFYLTVNRKLSKQDHCYFRSNGLIVMYNWFICGTLFKRFIATQETKEIRNLGIRINVMTLELIFTL